MRCTLPSFIPPYTTTSGPYNITTAEEHAYKLYVRKSPLSMVQDILGRVEGGLTSLTLDIIDKDHNMWDAGARQRAEFEDFKKALVSELKAYVRSHRSGVESEERSDLMGRFAAVLNFLEGVKGGKGVGKEAVH
ncbi:hypothetical protein BJY00DRAFT_317328 [Aspergillus carlsbadensis]|nr:hypothetical protein BJY00DRAFT_317328 [Aspergillus carlsbadensis]